MVFSQGKTYTFLEKTNGKSTKPNDKKTFIIIVGR